MILVVDDEPNIVQLARLYLEREGFRVDARSDGSAVIDTVESSKPALVILDIMLPGMDGISICRMLRARSNLVPVIMLTARDEDIDKILGLEMGADDYLTKPFNPRELVARVRAILRRSERPVKKSASAIHVGDVTIDPASREVVARGRPVNLRAQEFELLLTLAEHKGLVLSRDQLLEIAWGFDYSGRTRTVDVHVGQLRRKLAGSLVRIETVTGVGYKLVA